MISPNIYQLVASGTYGKGMGKNKCGKIQSNIVPYFSSCGLGRRVCFDCVWAGLHVERMYEFTHGVICGEFVEKDG